MASFTTNIDTLITTLQNDAALSSFCNTKWGKSITVVKEFHQRTEINLNSLPIIIITRPSVERIFLPGGVFENRHNVNLFCGFQQDDKSKVLYESIEFEEKIIDALASNNMLQMNLIEKIEQMSIFSEGEVNAHFLAVAIQIFVELGT